MHLIGFPSNNSAWDPFHTFKAALGGLYGPITIVRAANVDDTLYALVLVACVIAQLFDETNPIISHRPSQLFKTNCSQSGFSH